ncbi:AAA family ATPase [Streptomyces coffeae]|uniref:AAA family ATPase n=1 Tax=Streptomyces coffeae TaxID=621382 RepID=A0ABS1ND81_9ACTN|nr:AAA family ATPase [Streptomyces coffeae]MBL1097781.1 AAA family ATPase [Streptomyces coffeae]
MSNSASHLLDRNAELTRVESLLDNTARGVSGLLVVRGLAGTGRTTVLSRGCQSARDRGFVVLSACASPCDRDFALGIVRQLLEPVCYAPSGPDRDAQLGETVAEAIQVLEAESLDGKGDASRGELQTLLRLVAMVAVRRPVLVAVDDLQWADVPSLHWLNWLLCPGKDLPVAGLISISESERSADTSVIDEILSCAQQLRLGPLTEVSTGSLAEAFLGAAPDEAFARACHVATGGNPATVRTLLAALADDGVKPTAAVAPTLRDLDVPQLLPSLYSRMRRVSPYAPSLARAVAVLGDQARLDWAAAIAGVEGAVAAEVVSSLTRAGVLSGTPDALTFTCALARTALLGDFAEVDRAVAHSRAACLLYQDAASAESVASHLLQSPALDAPWACDVLHAAARTAMIEGRQRTAVSYLRRLLRGSLDNNRRATALISLGRTELGVEVPSAVEHLVSGLEKLDDPRMWVETARTASQALGLTAGYDTGIALLKEARAKIGQEHPSQAAVDCESDLVALEVSQISSAGDGCARLANLESVDRAGEPAQTVTALRSYQASQLGESAETTVHLAELALAGGDLGDGALPPTLALLALIRADALASALRHCDDGLRDAQCAAFPPMLAVMRSLRAQVALRLGRVTDAWADAQTAVECFDSLGLGFVPGAVSWAVAPLVEALAERGEFSNALALLQARGLAGPLPESLPSTYVLYSRGRLHAALGDARRGREDLLLCGRWWHALGARSPSVGPWRSEAALAVAALGDGPEACRLAEEELELARRWGTPGVVGRAMRAVGALTGGRMGIELLTASVDVLEGSPARLELARALGDLGAALRHAGRNSHARERSGSTLRSTSPAAAGPTHSAIDSATSYAPPAAVAVAPRGHARPG